MPDRQPGTQAFRMMCVPQGGAALLSVKAGQLSVFFLLCLTAPLAMADSISGAHGWLVRMSTALQSLSYEGVFVHRSDDQLTAMKVIHIAGDDGEHERLITLTGKRREIVHRSGHPARVAGNSKGTHSGVAGILDDITDYYKLTLRDRDRVAGRPAQVIFIEPRDEYRYGYRLWLDEATGLLLKSDLLGLNGHVIEQVMFTSLNLVEGGEHAEDSVSPGAEVDRAAIGDAVPETLQPPQDWTVGDVPNGFSLMMVQPVSTDHNARHMIYTDGLASVSIFVETSDEDANTSFVGSSRMGAVSAYGKLMNGYQVTVVGEVPEVTVEMIGKSMRYKGLE